jgi:pimeloyl-[acyl-carrier protein] methyl ester esterase
MEACAANLCVETVGHGRPLVLLHGWAMHAGLFAPLLPALADRHRVHAVDLPGHGRSDSVHPWTLDAVVEALEARFSAEEGPLDVLGWSLGGAAALAWAHAHPRRIARLVLVATSPKFVADAQWPHGMTADTLDKFADELRVAYRATLLRFLSLQVHGSVQGRETLATLRRHLFSRGEPDAGVLDQALAAFRGVDLRDRVGAIAQPALVVTGGRDTLARAEAGAWLAAALPEGRLFAMPDAGHAPFLSHGRAFTDAMLAFLGDG